MPAKVRPRGKRRWQHWLLLQLLTILLFPSLTEARDQRYPEARHYAFQLVGTENGLSTAEVISIVQDRDGFLWIGSSEGLLRYDGINIKRYRADDGVPDRWIGDLGLAADDTLWVATDNGVAHFDGHRFVPLQVDKFSIESTGIQQKIAFSSRGGIYLATNSGLLFAQPGRPALTRIWSVNDGIPQSTVEAVFCDSDGTVWFASGHRLGRLDPTTGRVNMLAVALPAEPVIAILRESNGKLWVRTPSHLGFLEGDKFILDEVGVPKANIYGRPNLDRSGNILIPTAKGLVRRWQGRWELVGHKQGLVSNSVLSVAEDREGAYWIGHEGEGLERWSGPNEWSGWTESEGLPDNAVWAVLRDSRDRLWVGTINGVAMWDPRQSHWRTWDERNGLASARVRGIASAADGDVLVWCHPRGLTRFASATLTPTKIKEPPDMGDLTVRPDGSIWIGSPSHLWQLVKANGEHSLREIPLPISVEGTTQRFATAAHGILWAGGPKGLSRFDGRTWTSYTTADGLRSNYVWDLAALNENQACFIYAHWSGVTCIQLFGATPRLRHFDTRNDFALDPGYYIEADPQGRLWVGGSHGLTRIEPNGAVTPFTHHDGLLWDDLSERAFFADSDGSLLFGTSIGLARYAPAEKRQSALHENKVVFTSVLLGNQEHGGESSPEVSYTDNSFRVQFALPTFRDPASVLCRHRLKGLESRFNESYSREARYSSVPSGAFEFEVSCRSSDGIWSPASTFSFQIRPAWWQRWWFRAMEGILAALLVWGIIRYRTYSLELERQKLEKMVAQHSAELATKNRELAEVNRELKEASLTDPLTGLRNRRFFHLTIETNVSRVLREYASGISNQADVGNRQNRDIVFYIIDIDQFKVVNDTYGHAVGDAVLIEAASRISSAIRRPDTFVRWGGEEFLVASYQTDRAEAEVVAARIMASFSERPFIMSSAIAFRKTCSIGWAPFPWLMDDADKLHYQEVLTLADRALYFAKESGRNRAIGIVPPACLMQSRRANPRVVHVAGPNGESTSVQLIETDGPNQPVESATVFRAP